MESKPSTFAVGQRQFSREGSASLWSRITFQWLSPLFLTGYKRPLEIDDIWMVNPDRSVDVLNSKFTPVFSKCVALGVKNPLRQGLYQTFKSEIWIGGLCRLVADIFQISAPFALRFLILYSTDAMSAGNEQISLIGKGLGLAFGISIMLMSQSIAATQFTYRGMMVGAQSRSILVAQILEKSLKLSGRAQAGGSQPGAENGQESERRLSKPWDNGRVLNLMSMDAQRIEQASAQAHMLWTAPIAIFLGLAYLIVNISYNALAGYAFLIVLMPLLTMAIRSVIIRRRAVNILTDQRVSLTQEMIQAIKFLKCFCWEPNFLEHLQQLRKQEIRGIQGLLAMRNAIQTIALSLPIYAAMLSFVTLACTSDTLDAARVFSSVAIFNAVRIPLNQLPLVIGEVIDALSALARIEMFLLAEERQDDFVNEHGSPFSITMKDASFTWESAGREKPTEETSSDTVSPDTYASRTEVKETFPPETRGKTSSISDVVNLPFRVKDLNLEIKSTELIAVIGPVGSGKTSLLSAFAGEMRMLSGETMLNGSKAFCPQYAWIQNATLRDNITFGSPFDYTRYWDVIDSCALRADLEILPHGDLTEIGERGINLSGGQKQRINIARAMYSKADITILDDPLSAVDAHVGRHIFDQAITTFMKDTCRILATHQIHILSRCDRTIWLRDGRIKAFDTYDNLMRDYPEFVTLTMSTTQEAEKSSSEEEIQRQDVAQDEKKAPGAQASSSALMQKEDQATSGVPWNVYFTFIAASGNIWNAPLVLLILTVSQVANLATSLWLAIWVEDSVNLTRSQYIGIYTGIAVIQLLLFFFYGVTITSLGANASRNLLNRALTRTLRAPMSFFETTPHGRIMNRFSKDVDTLDNSLSEAIRLFAATLASILGTAILIIYFFHYFAIAFGVAFILVVVLMAYYRGTARELKRHESVLRSVVFARFSEILSGASSIRAYSRETQFLNTLCIAIDDMNRASFLAGATQRWVSLRIDFIGNTLVLVIAVLVATAKFHASPGIAGLVMSAILPLVWTMQATVRQFAEVESGMNSVQRLHHYCAELEEEAPLHAIKIPEDWPQRGNISFSQVQMRYRPGLPLTLDNVNLEIMAGEHVGIVGRTGAGKSSILTALFRLVELSSGSITIDNLNISTLGLHELRRKVAIIPQDSTLFLGTIRSNIDPFNEHSDAELWSALHRSNLVSADSMAKSQQIEIDSPVTADGLNFSLGQRQLLSLARVLLRDTRIVVCDEATSSVDIQTDEAIQRTMVTAFAGKTLLCIAHRLKTIINYDKICVMDRGCVVEWGPPKELWKQGGIFRQMCDQQGITEMNFEVSKF